MKRALGAGIGSGVAFGGWSAVTMFWPVSYIAWDIGRSVVFIGFVVALVVLAVAIAKSESSLWRPIYLVTVAVVVSGALSLAAYAAVTGPMAHRIVQLPEYARDYSYHGYTSPAEYLAANYWDLLWLQVFSWAVGGVIVIGVASVAGWLLRGVRPLRAA